jgi:hypothetical protein
MANKPNKLFNPYKWDLTNEDQLAIEAITRLYKESSQSRNQILEYFRNDRPPAVLFNELFQNVIRISKNWSVSDDEKYAGIRCAIGNTKKNKERYAGKFRAEKIKKEAKGRIVDMTRMGPAEVNSGNGQDYDKDRAEVNSGNGQILNRDRADVNSGNGQILNGDRAEVNSGNGQILNRDRAEVNRGNGQNSQPNLGPIFASFNQGNARFGFVSNTQCVAMCVAAMMKSKITPVSDWSTQIMDEVLDIGNYYYAMIVWNILNNVPDWLLVNQLPKSDSQLNNLFGRNFELNFARDPPREFSQLNTGLAGLIETVGVFFALHQYGVIIDSNGFARLIFRSDDGQRYYLFDSHATIDTANASIEPHRSIESLARELEVRMVGATQYTIDFLEMNVMDVDDIQDRL